MLMPLISAFAVEVQELDLRVNASSLDHLLEFLSCSFSGGTDVDAPLKLSLERMKAEEWEQVCGRVGGGMPKMLSLCEGEADQPLAEIDE